MTHKALLAAKNECTALVREANAELDRVADNDDLTPEAKRRLEAELASEFIVKLQESTTLARARGASEHVLQNFEAKIDSKLQPATDAQSVGVHAQIRDQLQRMHDPKERMSFLEHKGSDLTLISAALSAPPYVSNLTDVEVALLRKKLEQHAPAEIIKERDFVQKALAEVERGFRAARARIAKRGGLEKTPDGSWGQAAA